MSPIRMLLLMLLLTACAAQSPAPTPTPTTPPLVGDIDIRYPPDGTQVYAEVLRIRGVIDGVPAKTFELRLIGPDDTILKRATVEAEAGDWQIDLLHDYAGEPLEVAIIAAPAGETQTGIYDAALIQIAGLAYRPPDFEVRVTGPAAGASVGGEQFEASGLFSGYESVMVRLVADDGRLLDEQPINTANPFVVDILPWHVALSPAGYTGSAVVRLIAADREIARQEIVIREEAG